MYTIALCIHAYIHTYIQVVIGTYVAQTFSVVKKLKIQGKLKSFTQAHMYTYKIYG